MLAIFLGMWVAWVHTAPNRTPEFLHFPSMFSGFSEQKTKTLCESNLTLYSYIAKTEVESKVQLSRHNVE